jgi:two-component system, chemotaxis family, sensor kinase CheA
VNQDQNLVFEELEERAEKIFATIDELRAKSGDGKQRRELLDSIFRDVHSVKGAASASDLHQLGTIAHEFEGLLHSLRIGEARLDQQVLQAVEEAAQALLDELGPHDSGNQSNHTALFSRLRQLSNSPSNRRIANGESFLNALDPEIRQTLSQEEKYRLEESVGEGANSYLVTTNFDLTDFDKQFQDLKNKLTERGEVISTAPKVQNENPGKINFRILYTSDVPLRQIESDLAQLADVSVSEVFSPHPMSANPVADESAFPINVCATGGESAGTAAPESSSIRITLDDLDRVISSVHKLLQETTDTFDRAIENHSDPGVQLELESKAVSVNNSFMELAAQIINLRMISIDRILQRALRSGRAAALAAGKEVDFVITGRDLHLDKFLCDAIGDPLIHLVRNAVDHGIENPRQRSQNGKNERGTVRIEATTTQGRTCLTVTDDGRGIDRADVSKVAISLGLAEEGTILDMDHAMRLIFQPGFSTAASASGISGRGVGLDVVETAVKQVGGEVKVISKPGVGSSFEIRLPENWDYRTTMGRPTG